MTFLHESHKTFYLQEILTTNSCTHLNRFPNQIGSKEDIPYKCHYLVYRFQAMSKFLQMLTVFIFNHLLYLMQAGTNTRYTPTTQIIYSVQDKKLTMFIKMEKEGCYQATVSYGDIRLKNGEFNILVLNSKYAKVLLTKLLTS